MEFRELVAAPAGWFIVGTLFVLSTAGVFLIWMGPWQGALVLLGLAGIFALWVSSMAYRITVDSRGIRVGRSLLEWEFVGEAAHLTVAETQDLSGPAADARAWLTLPPYTRRAVRVEVRDAADPHPYWLVGTRRPEEFAAAVNTRNRHVA